VRVARGFGEDLLHNTSGQFTGALVLLQDDEHSQSRFNICSRFAIHNFNLPGFPDRYPQPKFARESDWNQRGIELSTTSWPS